MSEVTCMRIVEFDAGHRVAGHESKCARLHGHRYKIELHARVVASKFGGRSTDDIGRVVDFSVLKELIGGWIDDKWDHRLLIWEDDDCLALSSDEERSELGITDVPFNPTAENMAQHLVDVVCPSQMEGTGVEVYYVVVWETPNCYATATKSRTTTK